MSFCVLESGMEFLACFPTKNNLENLVYHFSRQLWLVLGVNLMDINSNDCFPGSCEIDDVFQGRNLLFQGVFNGRKLTDAIC